MLARWFLNPTPPIQSYTLPNLTQLPKQTHIESLLPMSILSGPFQGTKVKEPDTFDWKSSKLTLFVHQLETVFHFLPHAYNTKKRKICYASMFFAGPCLEWWNGTKKNLTPQPFDRSPIPWIKWSTFEEFWRDLSNDYGNRYEMDKAQRDLQMKFQGPKERTTNFVSAVWSLQLKAKFNSERLWEFIISAVRPEIHELIDRLNPYLIKSPSKSVELCSDHVLPAGHSVEERNAREIRYAQAWKSKEFLRSKNLNSSNLRDSSKKDAPLELGGISKKKK